MENVSNLEVDSLWKAYVIGVLMILVKEGKIDSFIKIIF